MIDLGRKRDLEVLMIAVNDPSEPMMRRRHAYRTMSSIRRKMRDTRILKMRLRLIAATMNNDLTQVNKISERLNDYERKHHTNRSF